MQKLQCGQLTQLHCAPCSLCISRDFNQVLFSFSENFTRSFVIKYISVIQFDAYSVRTRRFFADFCCKFNQMESLHVEK